MAQFLSMAVVIAAALSQAAISSGSEFDYNHQDQWEGTYCHASTYQSPINIQTNNLTQHPFATNLAFSWGNSLSGVFKNNGHTVKFTPSPGQPTASTTTHLGQYKLQEVHMHWGENDGVGSEHRINGEQASLEIYFVLEGKLPVVIAIMADAGSESASSVFNSLPLSNVLNYNTQTPVTLPLHKFLPTDRSYYYYRGFPTTPPCYDGEFVFWFVLKERIVVPRSYLAKLRTIRKDEAGNLLQFNYRDPQPLFCRTVYEHVDPNRWLGDYTWRC